MKHGFGEAGTEVWVLSRGEAATASPRATVSPATTALPLRLRLPSLPCRPTVRGRFDSGLSLLYFGPTRPRFVAWNHAANGDRGAWGTQDTETVVWRVSEWLAATLEMWCSERSCEFESRALRFDDVSGRVAHSAAALLGRPSVTLPRARLTCPGIPRCGRDFRRTLRPNRAAWKTPAGTGRRAGAASPPRR